MDKAGDIFAGLAVCPIHAIPGQRQFVKASDSENAHGQYRNWLDGVYYNPAQLDLEELPYDAGSGKTC